MKTNNNFFYIFISLVVLMIFALQYSFWFSHTGYLNYKKVKSEVFVQQEEVVAKEENNNKLYSEVTSLRNNSSVIESLARENMGYVKKGEFFYSVQ
jgi:cell division protein FtsB